VHRDHQGLGAHRAAIIVLLGLPAHYLPAPGPVPVPTPLPHTARVISIFERLAPTSQECDIERNSFELHVRGWPTNRLRVSLRAPTPTSAPPDPANRRFYPGAAFLCFPLCLASTATYAFALPFPSLHSSPPLRLALGWLWTGFGLALDWLWIGFQLPLTALPCVAFTPRPSKNDNPREFWQPLLAP
jgi:hypothetical protein